MSDAFKLSLQKLKGSTITVANNDAYPPERGYASIYVEFSTGAKLRADYWRILLNGKAYMSSFDHAQKYGLPAPINAINVIIEKLEGQSVTDAELEDDTGDLVFSFTGNIKLQVFNFTYYEIWEMRFPNGAVEYSNYVLTDQNDLNKK